MLSRSSSDPVLIKPSISDFILEWNGIFVYHQPLDPNDDPNYGVLIKVSDFDKYTSAVVEQRHYKSKCEKRLRRARSLMLAQSRFDREHFKNSGTLRSHLHRSNSSVDFTVSCQPQIRKRVSFSFLNENILIDVKLSRKSPPSRHCSEPNGNRPQKPILRKKSRSSSLPLSHMDFDSFAAWRRGSRLSDDVVEYLSECELKEVQRRHKLKMKELKREEREAKRQLKGESWGLCDIFKSAFVVCFSSRRTQKTSPEDSADIIPEI